MKRAKHPHPVGLNEIGAPRTVPSSLIVLAEDFSRLITRHRRLRLARGTHRSPRPALYH